MRHQFAANLAVLPGAVGGRLSVPLSLAAIVASPEGRSAARPRRWSRNSGKMFGWHRCHRLTGRANPGLGGGETPGSDGRAK